MVMGWGWKKYNYESLSNVLKEANVTLIDSENCGTADTLCTEGTTGQHGYFKLHLSQFISDVSVSVHCDILIIKYNLQGDSGGLLVEVLHRKLGKFYKTSVYTHISHYFSWIHDNMKPPTQQQYEAWKGKLDQLI